VTSALTSDDLHLGRDASDATWVVVRYGPDWAGGVFDRALYDPLSGRLELGALTRPPSPDDGPLCDGGVNLANLWLPLEPVTGPDGDQYRSDPRHDRVLRRRACDAEFTALPGFGGTGWQTGRVRLPLGLACDQRGLLFVADACNHRVQVVRPADGSVVTVLGRVDGYGAPLAGVDGGAMLEPVDVAVDPCRCHVFVADRSGGKVHVFNQRFQWLRSFAPEPDLGWPAGMRTMPVGLALAADGTLLIADPHWPRLLHASAEGTRLGEVPLGELDDPRFQGLRLIQQFPTDGEAIIGPLDGGAYDTAWHQIMVEADVPAGTSIEVQSFASNEPAALGQFPRLRPVVASFTDQAGDPSTRGPGSGATAMTLGEEALRQVRVGDTLEVMTTPAVAAPDRPVIQAVPAAKVGLTVALDRALYGAGAELRLLARAGAVTPGGPRLFYTLKAGESIDLATDHPDVPHGAAAFFRPGDRIGLSGGGHSSEVTIAGVSYPSRTITFAPALTRDARVSQLILSVAPGRLYTADLTRYRLPSQVDEPVIVMGTSATGVAAIPFLSEPDTGALWVERAPLETGLVTFATWTRFVTTPHVPWAPERPVPRDQTPEIAPGSDDEDRDTFTRLVLSDTGRWARRVHGEYRRDRPVLASFPNGGGPAPNATSVTVPVANLPRLRAGDTVRLSSATRPPATQDLAVADLPPATVTLSVEESPALPLPGYTTGATARLRLRAGRPLPGAARQLHVLAASEVIDLSSAAADGSTFAVAVPHGLAAFLQAGDELELAQGAARTVLAVSSVSFAPAVAVVSTGAAERYGAGTSVTVRERAGGRLPHPIPLYRLGPGEAVDLRASGPATVAFPFGAALLFRAGDVIDLRDGPHTTSISVAAVDLDRSVVALGAPCGPGFGSGTLSLQVAPGRLLVDDLAGFEDQPPLDEPVTVSDGAGGHTTAAVLIAERQALWVDPSGLGGAVSFSSWSTFLAPEAQATDRGQYLWVRLRLVGRKEHPGDGFSVQSPSVRALRVSFQRPSLLRLLPATFSRRDEAQDPTGALFLERFLSLFESTFTRIEGRYEAMSRLLNPAAAPPQWLGWLASWLDLVFDPSWSPDRRRQLVLRAVDLYRRRGTVGSIQDWVEIYTGQRPELVEGFSTRVTPGAVLNYNATLGCALMVDECDCHCTDDDGTAHRFAVYASLLDPCQRELAEPALRAMVESIKPAHTAFDLKMVLPEASVGIQSTVGLDLTLGDGRAPAPSVLGLGVPPTTGGRFRPLLGVDLFLEGGPAPGALGSDGVRLDANLTLGE
jgi:phage tail-like protein